MKIYTEVGIGNEHFVSSEVECSNGTELRIKGNLNFLPVASVYLRVWIGHHVFILDSAKGFKHKTKDRKELKILIGTVSHEIGEDIT